MFTAAVATLSLALLAFCLHIKGDLGPPEAPDTHVTD